MDFFFIKQITFIWGISIVAVFVFWMHETVVRFGHSPYFTPYYNNYFIRECSLVVKALGRRPSDQEFNSPHSFLCSIMFEN